MSRLVESSELRSCVKVEVAVLGSSSLIVLMVSVKVVPQRVHHLSRLVESSELRSCVLKVEVAVLGCQSLIVLMVSVGVQQH